MTQEDKNLILKDLCARLPYGVKVQYVDKYGHSHIGKLMSINVDYVEEVIINWGDDCTFDNDIGYLLLEEVKPYLRPMSSMTQEDELELIDKSLGYYVNGHEFRFVKKPELIDCLNKNMFDYRGLIPKDLALSTEEFNPYKI